MLEIIDYSEKSIAVIGNTKEVKDQLKSLGGKFNARLRCGAGWVFPKAKRADIEALNANAGETAQTVSRSIAKPKGITPEVKDKIRAYYTKVWGKDEKMINYCVNKIGHAIELSNGLILSIEKPRIETHFCFGYSLTRDDTDYDNAEKMAYHATTDADYFRNKNLAPLDKMIDELKKCSDKDEWGYSKRTAYLYVRTYHSYPERVLCNVKTAYNSFEGIKEDIEMTWGPEQASHILPLADEDYESVLALYEEARKAFSKRIETYLKRYGLDKLHVWTYWRDA